MNRYNSITASLGCRPTFAITAVTLARHPHFIRKLSQQGVEFAVHGYIHTDYRSLPSEEQDRHFKKAIKTFSRCQVPFTGFRAPFLRINGKSPELLSNLGFQYDSSQTVHCDIIDKIKYPEQSWHAYEMVLDFYQPRQYPALPRFTQGFVEIPVLIPDDDMLVDRLGITDSREITKIWQDIFRRTHSQGELFTVQLHPERIAFCESALIALLQQARESNPSVWVATLEEIAEWWKERNRFTFEINSQGDDRYRVKAHCSDRATVLLRNSQVNVPVSEWLDGYQSVTAREFVLQSPKRPVIGIDRDSSPEAVSFLQREGYIVESSTRPDNYGVYLSDLAHFRESDEKLLSREIERTGAPLLRYWRWPDQARSALSVTGDIDSITLIDFVLRILENWRQDGRQRGHAGESAENSALCSPAL
jgi:peptidoglycan/xylan/chitin deacetylase (PgdA/CDA1 family)